MMIKWLWLALIPSLAFSAPRTCNMRLDPVYVDVHPDKVILCDQNTEIPADELTGPESAFERFLQGVELQRKHRYIVLILRPGSGHLRQQLRDQVLAHDIDLGIELWEAGREFPDNKKGSVSLIKSRALKGGLASLGTSAMFGFGSCRYFSVPPRFRVRNS